MQRNLKVLLVKPNELPKEISIKNTLKAKQEVLGGYIEYVSMRDYEDIAIICNEGGKILGLPPNRAIDNDIIVGNFLIVGDDAQIGEDRSLTKKQIEKYTEIFGEKSIQKTNEKISELYSNMAVDDIIEI